MARSEDIASGERERFGPERLHGNTIDRRFGMAPRPARPEAIHFSNTLAENTGIMVRNEAFPAEPWAELEAPANGISVDVGSSRRPFATRVPPGIVIDARA